MEGLTEEELELLDPHPDIHALFCHYNTLYFDEKLGACSVEWSSGRMTSCGGVCEWRPGGGCRIKLSEPLLKLRPARDLKMVLLHEMVHAYMMLGGIKDDDPGGHGTIFQSVIARINTSTQPDHQRPSGGYNITITHNYIAEAEHYRRHWWRCDRCDRVVKRAMNRPPQEADCRLHVRGRDCGDAACSYHMHVKHCGGTFVKIKEPEGFQDKKKKKAEDAGGSSSEAAAAAAGSSDGGASQRPDGVPLPAKRPKKAGGRLAGAGDRPITDFFPTRGSSGPGTGPAAAGEAGGASGSGQGGGVLPALQAVADHMAAASGQQQRQQHAGQQQQQQQQAQQQTQHQSPAEPSAERRRLLAEAALRRLGGAQGASGGTLPPHRTQQQQHQPQEEQRQGAALPPPPQQQQQQEAQQQAKPAATVPLARQAAASGHGAHPSGGQGDVVDLAASSDDEELALAERLQQRPPAAGRAAVAAAAAAGLGGGPSSAAAPPPGPPAGSAAAAAAGANREEGAAACPICGQRWRAGELSNAALNAHVDECLTLASVAVA